jgi:hypothetical protein
LKNSNFIIVEKRSQGSSGILNIFLTAFAQNQVKLPRRLEPECFPHYMKKENQASRRTYYASTSILGQIYDKVVKNVDGLGYRPEGIFLFFQNPESEIVDASRKFINSSANNTHVLYKIGKLL